MKFLIDAHLPRKLGVFLQENGFDAIHTRDLRRGNYTSDADISELADQENRVVVTKDGDFLETKLLQGVPKLLLIVSTGNISNRSLLKLFAGNLQTIMGAFQSGSTLVEFGWGGIHVHD